MNNRNYEDYQFPVEGMAQLIGAVLGTSIEKENIVIRPNGRMNRPEDRGGLGVDYLQGEDGKFWLELAESVALETSKLLPKFQGIDKSLAETIQRIASDPEKFGYQGIGKGNWDAQKEPQRDIEYYLDYEDEYEAI